MIRQTAALRWVVALAGALAGALFVPVIAAAATTEPIPVPTPAIPGALPLPGPVLSPPAKDKPASEGVMGILNVSPSEGVAGTPVTITGAGLSAGKAVKLVWMTTENTWKLDPRPDSVDYRGRTGKPVEVVIGEATTDASGSFSYSFKAPEDWGDIHDVYAVVEGVRMLHGGFLNKRWAEITPRKGPLGTPVKLTIHGLGSSLYGGAIALYYDNHYSGALTSIWTRGVAQATIRAAGGVGVHTITFGNGASFNYLNIQQSPIPWATSIVKKFDLTKGKSKSLPEPKIDWPLSVAPTIAARTTMGLGGTVTGNASASLSPSSGQVGDSFKVSASGLGAGPVALEFGTVVGNRVNCKGTCWAFSGVPLGTATPSGGSLEANVKVPDGLGGWHAIQLSQEGKVKAQVPFYVKRSIYGVGTYVYETKTNASTNKKEEVLVPSAVVKRNQKFVIHLKGLGWTQLDNTIAIDYDNSYVGYACGFNSNGDVEAHVLATGRPGIHLIDMYPLLYTQQPSYAEVPYGMVPFLAFERDEPGLAAGYDLPAMRLAIRVVEPGGATKPKHHGKKHKQGKKHAEGKHAGQRRASPRVSPRLLPSG
jgi:hypothetical protein